MSYRLRVLATGDDVGNNGSVLVYRRDDGSVTLIASRRVTDQTVWLTRQQAGDLGLALLNAAHGDRSQTSTQVTGLMDERALSTSAHSEESSRG